MLKTIIIIQARMGASRLPNKMLLHLHGYPICEWIFARVKKANKVDQIIFALPDTKDNDVLDYYLQSIGALVYRGSEADVVDRYYRAAKWAGAKIVVRVCADNPFICASEIDRLIDFFKNSSCDYAYNHIPKNNKYPDGFGAEICSMELLKDIYEKSTSKDSREHLFNYIWNNKTYYSIRTFDPHKSIAYPKLKFDIDTMEDYKELLSKNYKIDMTAREIIEVATR